MEIDDLRTGTLAHEWCLADIRIAGGLEVVIERQVQDGVELLHGQKCQFIFRNPASWALSDLSQMWQYYRDDDCPPVVQVVDRSGDSTFVADFTLNTESFGFVWMHYRINAGSDVIDVLSRTHPSVRML